jgi:DNA primase large subunit
MYERLASEHHLKHYGLQQMSLFLKHIGLPLEQAVLFWRSMFSPRWGREFSPCTCVGFGGLLLCCV